MKRLQTTLTFAPVAWLVLAGLLTATADASVRLEAPLLDAEAGDHLSLPITLVVDGGEEVAGISNDLSFDPVAAPIADRGHNKPACAVEADVPHFLSGFAFLPVNCIASIGGCTGVRVLIAGLDIEDGAARRPLYRCAIDVPLGTAPGIYPVEIGRARYSRPSGIEAAVLVSGGGVAVARDRIPTPTPTPLRPTARVLGRFCTGDCDSSKDVSLVETELVLRALFEPGALTSCEGSTAETDTRATAAHLIGALRAHSEGCATPTATSRPTASATRTPPFTGTRTQTVTRTPSVQFSSTPTRTVTATRTPTITRAPTWTPTSTPTRTRTPTRIPTRTRTATRTGTSTQTATLTLTSSVTQTRTHTPTITATAPFFPTTAPTLTRTSPTSVTPTQTPAITQTPTMSPSATVTSTGTLTPTIAPAPTSRLSPTTTPTTTSTRTPTVTRSPTPTATSTATPTAARGPVLTHFGIAHANGTLIQPVGTSSEGIPIFELPLGFGFIIVVEGRRGADSIPVGTSSFHYDSRDPNVLPDLQILASRLIGNGSTAVCDKGLGGFGVPAVSPPDFTPTSATSAAINDFGCRFVNGSGFPVGRLVSGACVLYPDGVYRFANSESEIQFCATISRLMVFPKGETLLMARLRNIAGVAGGASQIIVRSQS